MEEAAAAAAKTAAAAAAAAKQHREGRFRDRVWGGPGAKIERGSSGDRLGIGIGIGIALLTQELQQKGQKEPRGKVG
ncbi:hypothetical protein ETH_00041495, partial [Eimeria tenella]